MRGKPIVLPREVLVVIHPGSQLEGWKRFHRGSPELNRCISRGLAKNITITQLDAAYVSSQIASSFASVPGSADVGALEMNGSSLIRNHSTIDGRLVVKLGGNSTNRTFFLYRKNQPSLSWLEIYSRELENCKFF